jgi:hypothetical protein
VFLFTPEFKLPSASNSESQGPALTAKSQQKMLELLSSR